MFGIELIHAGSARIEEALSDLINNAPNNLGLTIRTYVIRA